MFTLLNSIKFLKQLKNLLKIFTSPRRVWEFICFIYTHILYLWYCHLHFSFPDFFSFWSIWYIWPDCGFIYVVFTTDYFKLSVPCVWTDCIIDSSKFLLIYVIIFFFLLVVFYAIRYKTFCLLHFLPPFSNISGKIIANSIERLRTKRYTGWTERHKSVLIH